MPDGRAVPFHGPAAAHRRAHCAIDGPSCEVYSSVHNAAVDSANLASLDRLGAQRSERDRRSAATLLARPLPLPRTPPAATPHAMSESKQPSLSPVEEEREARRGSPPISRAAGAAATRDRTPILMKTSELKEYTERKGGEQKQEKQKQQHVQSPLLLPQFKSAPLPNSPQLLALTEPHQQQQQQQSPRSAAINVNSRIQRRIQKVRAQRAE